MVEIIAELSINHLGMRKIAEVMIRELSNCGVDYIKLKKKNVGDYYKPGKKYKGYDFINYRQSFELDEADFKYIDKLCDELGLAWFSTIHGPDSFDFISQFNPPFYKLASMDVRDFEFVRWIVEQNKEKRPIIISTGGQELAYIKKVAEYIRDKDIPLLVNHCVSIYPTDIKQANVYRILALRDQLEPLGCDIGYSGHETGWIPTLLAIQLGAKTIERHVTLSRDINIHHIEASLTLDEFAEMVADVRDLETLLHQKPANTQDLELSFLEERNYT